MLTQDEKMFAMLIYLLSFPFPILGPLIIWLIKKDDSAFVDFHGKSYFNFFISYIIFSVISMILILLLVGLILLWAVGIAATIFTIIAAVKAYNGEEYHIPLTFRFFN